MCSLQCVILSETLAFRQEAAGYEPVSFRLQGRAGRSLACFCAARRRNLRKPQKAFRITSEENQERCPMLMISFVVLLTAGERLITKTRNYEQSTSIGRHKKGRVHPDIGWQTQAMGRQRPALRGLGDVSPQRLAR